MQRAKFISSFLLIGFPLIAACDDSSQTRQYRPLEAKSVSIRPAARVIATPGAEEQAVALRKKAWKHFDLREWDQAFDAFLDSLEKDPSNVPAAEGLAMSLYCSGDYASAFRLGQELSISMPTVKRIVEETVLADVRYMIKEGDIEAAYEFLGHFPTEGEGLATARQMVVDADTITTALGPEGELVSSPPVGSPLATN